MNTKTESLDDLQANVGSAGRSVDGTYSNELNRWTLLLGLPMLAACLCIGLAFAVEPWFYAGAIAFGPGLGVFAIIYLAISSDTNATTSAHQLADLSRDFDSAPTSAAAA